MITTTYDVVHVGDISYFGAGGTWFWHDDETNAELYAPTQLCDALDLILENRRSKPSPLTDTLAEVSALQDAAATHWSSLVADPTITQTVGHGVTLDWPDDAPDVAVVQRDVLAGLVKLANVGQLIVTPHPTRTIRPVITSVQLLTDGTCWLTLDHGVHEFLIDDPSPYTVGAVVELVVPA